MIIINLSQEIEALARRLADAQHVSIEDTIRRALEASALAAGVLPEPGRPRDRSTEAAATRRARMDRIVRDIAAIPMLDRRSPREIMDDLNAL